MRLFALIVVLACVGDVRGEAPPELGDHVDRLVQPYLEAELINAVSIGIVHGDQQWTRHYGRLSADNPERPNDRTIYEIGSISKVFTGILLADAARSKRVALDHSIGQYVPEAVEKNRAVADAIQLRHLATHLSGLPRMPTNMNPADIANPYAGYGRQRMIDFLCGVQPERKPMVESEYSNYGVGLLGEILAIGADQSYAELLSETITVPLAMGDTTLTVPPRERGRLAPPHDAGLEPTRTWDFDAFAGAGGIRSTIADMQRFLHAHLHPPNSPLGETIELAWEQHAASIKGSFAMGLGWHIARDGATRWHNGQTGGYHSMLMADRRIDAGVVVLSNTATGQVDALAESVLKAVAGLPVEPIAISKPVAVNPDITVRLVGDYAITPNFVLSVRADGEKLYVRATGQAEARVFPQSDTKWKYRIVDAELNFMLPEQGPATELVLQQHGQELRAARIVAKR